MDSYWLGDVLMRYVCEGCGSGIIVNQAPWENQETHRCDRPCNSDWDGNVACGNQVWWVRLYRDGVVTAYDTRRVKYA